MRPLYYSRMWILEKSCRGRRHERKVTDIHSQVSKPLKHKTMYASGLADEWRLDHFLTLSTTLTYQAVSQVLFHVVNLFVSAAGLGEGSCFLCSADVGA